MKNKLCFIDSGTFIALNDPKDQHHRDSIGISTKLKAYELIISDAVISETYALLRYRLGFHSAHRFLTAALDEDKFRIAKITPEIRNLALELLEKYNDQKISYCDGLSGAIMKTEEFNEIFTFDHHFEIMGFNRVAL